MSLARINYKLQQEEMRKQNHLSSFLKIIRYIPSLIAIGSLPQAYGKYTSYVNWQTFESRGGFPENGTDFCSGHQLPCAQAYVTYETTAAYSGIGGVARVVYDSVEHAGTQMMHQVAAYLTTPPMNSSFVANPNVDPYFKSSKHYGSDLVVLTFDAASNALGAVTNTITCTLQGLNVYNNAQMTAVVTNFTESACKYLNDTFAKALAGKCISNKCSPDGTEDTSYLIFAALMVAVGATGLFICINRQKNTSSTEATAKTTANPISSQTHLSSRLNFRVENNAIPQPPRDCTELRRIQPN